MRVNVRGASAVWAPFLLLVAVPAAGADDLRLAEAVKNRDGQAVRRLLEQQVDVNAPQPDGATALHWAVHWDDPATVELLIRAGAEVNAANDYGVTPLSLACTNGNAAIVDMLLKTGADPGAASPVTGETALMTAARTGIVEVVQALLDHRADVNASEVRHGQTALMWAAAEGHTEVGADTGRAWRGPGSAVEGGLHSAAVCCANRRSGARTIPAARRRQRQ